MPYHKLRTDFAVIKNVIEGIRPERPTLVAMSDDIWSWIQQAWDGKPNSRPTLSSFVDRCLPSSPKKPLSRWERRNAVAIQIPDCLHPLLSGEPTHQSSFEGYIQDERNEQDHNRARSVQKTRHRLTEALISGWQRTFSSSKADIHRPLYCSRAIVQR